jgi:chromosome condensin MukBEF ATPase and DNA-binding subunit MukB
MHGAVAAGLLFVLSIGAALAADGAGPGFDFETGGAAAAVGEVAERSLRSELTFCGGEAKDIAKTTPKLMKDWRKRNRSWLSASLAVRAVMRARLAGNDAANNGPIFDRDFEQSIAGVAQRGTDRLRSMTDPEQRMAACRSLVADVKAGRRDVSAVNEKATEMLRGYLK